VFSGGAVGIGARADPTPDTSVSRAGRGRGPERRRSLAGGRPPPAAAVAAFGCRATSPDHARNVAPHDVVAELVGAPNLARDRAVWDWAEDRRHGVARGTEDGIDLRALMTRRAVIRGSTRRARSAEEKADVVGGVAEGGLPLIAGRRL
jgi:hypothetical protein